MARGKKVFTKEDKVELKTKLQDICKAYWIVQGYKDTSISELCSKAGISTGAFYSLYKTKEDLFYEVLTELQTLIYRNFIDQISHKPTKQGFENAILNLYNEYISKPFLYNVSTPDFTSFYNKLTDDKKEKLMFDSSQLFRKAIQTADLKLKLEEKTAFSVFGILLSSVTIKDQLPEDCCFYAAFQFMVHQLIESAFE